MVDDGVGISGRLFTIAAWIIGSLFSVIAGLIAWVRADSNRRISAAEASDQSLRNELANIKEDYVSRNTIVDIQNDWHDEMRELREDRRLGHEETKAWMLRIEAKIDSFKDDHLPHQLAQILSDVYGTIANNKRDIERQLDRIEGNTQRAP